MGIILYSEQMVPVPAVKYGEPKDTEHAIAAAENANLEEITWVYPQITVVNPT